MRRLVLLPLLAAALAFACATPPSKEMHQAQGAIDAARAAGAEQHAAAELQAAVDALARAEDAVSQRDYRLALNYALDARERAQEAAKAAVEGRAKARGDAERALAEVGALHTRARARLRDPEVSGLPARAVREPLATIDAAGKALQEARTAMAAGDYPRVTITLEGRGAALQAALAAIDAAAATQPPRRRR
jgi:hypothetical protein